MNGNQSYAQARSGALAGDDFSSFKQNAGSMNNDTPASLSAVNRQSTAFTYRSKDLSNKPNAYSSSTSGTFLDQKGAPGMAQ